MAEVLTPQPGQTIVDTNGGHRHHSSEWERTILREQEANFRQMSTERSADFRHVDRNQSEMVAAVTHGTEEEQENYSSLQKQISDSTTATVVGFKDAQATAYQIEGRTSLDAAKNAAAIAVQADKNWYQTQLQAQTNAAAATLLAQQLAATAAAQAAQCCCEVKELIKDDGSKTRDLISVNELGNANRRTAKAEQLLASYYSRNAVPVVP